MKRQILASLYALFMAAFSILGMWSVYSGLRRGFFFRPTGAVYCASSQVCIHEIGHKADQHSGWISSTVEYQTAVLAFSMTSDHPWAAVARTYQGGWQELYAQMLESAYGKKENMPAELQRFYDWKYIDTEVNRYANR
jgi:hypothetical protein